MTVAAARKTRIMYQVSRHIASEIMVKENLQTFIYLNGFSQECKIILYSSEEERNPKRHAIRFLWVESVECLCYMKEVTLNWTVLNVEVGVCIVGISGIRLMFSFQVLAQQQNTVWGPVLGWAQFYATFCSTIILRATKWIGTKSNCFQK